MTIYEHAMLGVNGALAAGLNRRRGWQIAALAGLASLVPDADGLTLLLGPRYYAEGHRVWTHNLLVAGIAAAILSAVVYQSDFFTRIQKRLMKHLDGKRDLQIEPVPASRLWPWLAVGVLAAYGHLLMDIFYSGGRDLPVWGVPIFWPFSDVQYDYPVVPWGDVGVTLIFIASMFAMLRWKSRTQWIAAGSLLAVAGYMFLRGAW
jgi:membrane-bound metal-dependent hydrolase YbcI (DUF457 family)